MKLSKIFNLKELIIKINSKQNVLIKKIWEKVLIKRKI